MSNHSSHPSRARFILDKYDLHPKKRLGQHFLVDNNILTGIVDACYLDTEDYVVEIGAGWGALTGYLADKAKGVLAIEIDNDLSPVLMEMFGDRQNVKFLFADVLSKHLEEEVQKAFALTEDNFTFKVCANLPYYITTPIIFHLLETAPHMEMAVLMMQREVADRLVAAPGSKEYGLATIMVAYHARVEMVKKVSRNCFFPRPEVESAVIRVIPWQSCPWQIKDKAIFKNLVRAAFQKRRKTILNITAGFFNLSKEETSRRLRELGIQPERRPETLTIEEFGKIANIFPE